MWRFDLSPVGHAVSILENILSNTQKCPLTAGFLNALLSLEGLNSLTIESHIPKVSGLDIENSRFLETGVGDLKRKQLRAGLAL